MFIPVLLAGTAIALASYALLSLVFSEERRVTRRLQSLGEYESQQALQVEPLLQPFRQRVVGPMATGLARGVRAFAPGDSKARTRARLVKAGNPGGLDADGFTALKGLAAAGTAILCLLLMVTLIGWPLAAIWAVLVVNSAFADTRAKKLLEEQRKTRETIEDAQKPPPPAAAEAIRVLPRL